MMAAQRSADSEKVELPVCDGYRHERDKEGMTCISHHFMYTLQLDIPCLCSLCSFLPLVLVCMEGNGKPRPIPSN